MGVFGAYRIPTARVFADSFWVESWYWSWEEIVVGYGRGGTAEIGREGERWGEIAGNGAKARECVETVKRDGRRVGRVGGV